MRVNSVRLNVMFMTDPRVQGLSEAMQRRLLMIMCLVGGKVHNFLSDTEIAEALQITEDSLASTKSELVEKGFIGHDWVLRPFVQKLLIKDSTNSRVARWRAKKKLESLGIDNNPIGNCNVTEDYCPEELVTLPLRYNFQQEMTERHQKGLNSMSDEQLTYTIFEPELCLILQEQQQLQQQQPPTPQPPPTPPSLRAGGATSQSPLPSVAKLCDQEDQVGLSILANKKPIQQTLDLGTAIVSTITTRAQNILLSNKSQEKNAKKIEKKIISEKSVKKIAKVKPKKEKIAKIAKLISLEPTTEQLTWAAYSDAYKIRYSVEPIRCAATNAMIKRIVAALGKESPQVATFFVSHNGHKYVSAMHQIGYFASDCAKLRTEWATGTMMSTTQATQIDRSMANYNAFAPLLAEAREREEKEQYLWEIK